MAILSGRPNLDERVSVSPAGVANDIFTSPAFREHLLRNHHGRNPFEMEASKLETEASQASDPEDTFQKDAARGNEKVVLYGRNEEKGPISIYGAKDSGVKAAYLSHTSGHLTCCNMDFMKDGSVEPHQETKAGKTDYSAGPGASPGGYVGARKDTSSNSNLYKKAA